MWSSRCLVVQASEPFGEVAFSLPLREKPARRIGRRWLRLGLAAALVIAAGTGAGLRAQAAVCWKGRQDQCERACAAGSLRSCNTLGVMHDEGTDAPLDHERAVQLYEQACSGGNATACGNLALSALVGEGMAADPRRAAALFAWACRADPADEARSCRELAGLYRRGSGIARDDGRAARLLQLACRHGDRQACSALAGTER